MKERHQGIVITQTPFRISFFGGGSDFSEYFYEHGGIVLGTAIDKYLYVTLNSLQRFFEKRIRLSYSKLEFVDNPEDLMHGIVKTILNDHPFFDERSFLDIHTYADLPASSGVGSSSAFTVGMLNALYLINGIYKTPEAIAREAIIVEREKLKDVGGWQDQVFAAYGGFNQIHFNKHGFSVQPICIPPEKVKALEKSCIMFFTGDTRSSNTVQQQAMTLSDKEKILSLKEIKFFATEALNVLYHSSDPQQLVTEFGALLHKAWEIKRNLSSNISNAKINSLYEKGIRAGALGGKLCGAGGGGFLLFIVPDAKREAVIQALADYKTLDVAFEAQGSRVIYSKTFVLALKNQEPTL